MFIVMKNYIDKTVDYIYNIIHSSNTILSQEVWQMGKIAIFPMSFEELSGKIEEYKKLFGDKPDAMPSWPHFAAWLVATEAQLRQVVDAGAMAGSTYYPHAIALKQMSAWMRGQILSSPGWAKQPAATKIFALNQLMCDGEVYRNATDKTQKDSGLNINISFGNGDKRGNVAFD